MKIKHIYVSKSYTGFFFDDQKAIKEGAQNDGFCYLGEPLIPGFTKVRQQGEAISLQIELENGLIGYGDCAAVQYSGTGGRDPLFLADDYIGLIREDLVPMLLKENIQNFRQLAEKYDHLMIRGKRLHTAIRYGITQALLWATAVSKGKTMAEIVREEYHIPEKDYHPIPVFSQSGDDRYTNVDKMILKEADVLPHALINNIDKKLGRQGEILKTYVAWLRDRILTHRNHDQYHPILHIDVYGTIGIIFANDLDKIVAYLLDLEKTARPFGLRIEGPIDGGAREATMMALKNLRERLDRLGSNLEIVADEWCNTLEDIIYFADQKAGHMLQIKTPDLGGVNNTIEAILYCNKAMIGSYCGGTCNETNISAEVTTNIAIACNASQCLAKPGMGFDEGYMIVKNEMNRVLERTRKR
ncbi:MAG: methylaspartate ammonia-lyase [Candidatus Izemoplasmatales bacterium]|nr:methylaspartate ammonia-lyase [Candidatus Izemoplasmatales bacterium]